MARRRFPENASFIAVLGLSILMHSASAPACVAAEPAPGAVSAFDSYAGALESRLTGQHQSQSAFLATAASDLRTGIRLRRGELIVEQLTPQTRSVFPGAMLHHWRGTAFAGGANAEDFERLLRDFNAYPRCFSPDVVEASVLEQRGDHLQARMRVRQRHGITVVIDADYDIAFGQLNARHRYSISRSTRVSEIGSPGTSAERVL